MNLDTGNLKNSIEQIITCRDDLYLMKQSVDQLYADNRSISDINADCQNDAHIIIPSGKAISPSSDLAIHLRTPSN